MVQPSMAKYIKHKWHCNLLMMLVTLHTDLFTPMDCLYFLHFGMKKGMQYIFRSIFMDIDFELSLESTFCSLFILST